MISFKKGDLLKADAEALVNTVNTFGVMGKGIALQFKNQFPHNYSVYREACKLGKFKIGEVLLVKDCDLLREKYIINFPTKEHWKSGSKYEYIEKGLKALKEVLLEHNIKSVALPPLGCGNGGLDWNKIKPMIVAALNDVPSEIQVFEPNAAIKTILQKENKTKQSKLTPARAMLLYLMFQYEGVGDISSLFSANKLAYFLQASGEPLRLKFQAHHYGPYTVQLNHVLGYLNGVYLKGLEQNEAKAFEPLYLNYNEYKEVEKFINQELSHDQRQRLDSVLHLIQGYESTYALELLATVGFLKKVEKENSLEIIKQKIYSWNSRKANLFPPEHIEMAYHHLNNYKGLFTDHVPKI
jgi:O-acetyl-ADP-ribose deacetylase (regulator of RNase III)